MRKNTPANNAYTGNRAEQDINGVTKMVSKRSFPVQSFSQP